MGDGGDPVRQAQNKFERVILFRVRFSLTYIDLEARDPMIDFLTIFRPTKATNLETNSDLFLTVLGTAKPSILGIEKPLVFWTRKPLLTN